MDRMLAGRYALASPLGTGGMARVVRGHDVVLDRPVAVKLLSAEGVDDVARERFRREARSSARLAHPNVVAMYDAGEDDGQLFLVMELVDGPSLAEVLAREGPFAVDRAIAVAGAVLAGLAAAHAAGFVHRDVKPGNVLLAPDGTIKLADFGIARRLDDLAGDLTTAGSFIGTARYASPEQLAGRSATAASDLYSTGVLVYEMLAGVPPFTDESPVATAIAHQTAPVPDLAARRPDVPPAVVAAVERAMAKDPAHRFATADDMRAALEATPVAPGPAAAAVAPATQRYPVATGVAPPPPAPLLAPPAARATDRRRPTWWWAAAIGLLAVAGAAIVAATRDGGPPIEGSPATTAPPAGTVAVTATPTSSPAPSAAPPVVPTSAPIPPAAAPGTIAELVSRLDAAPDLYGPRTPDVRAALGKIDGQGNDDVRRAGDLLDQAASWVDAGELDPAALPTLEALLGPIAARAEDEGDDGRGNGDGGNGNGNGNGNGGRDD